VSRRDAAPIWARPEPGERKPAHTRERIAEAALKIADAEGYEAVTMRRVATELGAGTMTLYHYVGNKDELIALMDDAIMGELLIPEGELADDWREGMAQIARRSYATFSRHPWIFEHIADEDSPNPGGPNGLRHFEQSLRAAALAGLDMVGQFELVSLVDDYVWGHAMRARADMKEHEGERGEERTEATIEYLRTQLAGGEFPHISSLVGDDIRGTFERLLALAGDETRFERGLQRLLDGIALDLERRA
jgi:AcrR family transcriptional regulator